MRHRPAGRFFYGPEPSTLAITMAKTSIISTITKRPEYLAVAATGVKKPMPGLVVQMRAPGDKPLSDIRVGLTVSAKAGGAVERSRIKRRLRHVIRDVLPEHGKPGFSYVVIGRRAALKRPFEQLKNDLKGALAALHKKA